MEEKKIPVTLKQDIQDYDKNKLVLHVNIYIHICIIKSAYPFKGH